MTLGCSKGWRGSEKRDEEKGDEEAETEGKRLRDKGEMARKSHGMTDDASGRDLWVMRARSRGAADR